jgi:hypothetical protein
MKRSGTRIGLFAISPLLVLLACSEASAGAFKLVQIVCPKSPSPPPADPRYAFSEDPNTSRLAPKGYVNVVAAASADDCRKQCDKDELCQGFNFSKAAAGGKGCEILWLAFGATPAPGRVSGIKGAAIRVEAATYRGACGTQQGKIVFTGAAKALCERKTSCTVTLPRLLSSQHCAGELHATWRCGNEPSLHTTTIRHNRPERMITLSCERSQESAIAHFRSQREIGSTLFYSRRDPPPELAGLVKEGLGTLVDLAQLKCEYGNRVLAGKALPGEPVPTALLPEDATAYRALLPDFYRYVSDMRRSALLSPGVGAPAQEDLVEILSNYACRQIARLIPGVARIVKAKIGGDGVQELDANSEIPPADKKKLNCEFTERHGGSAPSECAVPAFNPPTPPREKPIEVELCTVTHAQLAATLQADMARLVKKISSLPPPKTWFGRPATSVRQWIDPLEKRKFAPPPKQSRTLEERQEKLLLENGSEYVTRRLLGFYRWVGSNRNFVGAMKQLGEGANNKVQLTGDALKELPGPVQAEVGAQNAEALKRNQREVLRRAVFQWTDGYEYEQMASFIGTSPSVRKRAGKKVTGHATLPSVYLPREQAALASFWATQCSKPGGQCDCSELQAICLAPVEAEEREACKRCAEAAARQTCVEGKRTLSFSGRVLKVPTCKGVVRAFRHDNDCTKDGGKGIFADLKISTDDFGGNTLVGWLAVKIVEESTRGIYHHGPAVTNPSYWPWNTARFAAAHYFLGKQGGQAEIGEKVPENWYSMNIGRRYLDALPITNWQRCYLWADKNEFEKQRLCDNPRAPESDPKKRYEAVANEVLGGKRWEEVPLFRLALELPGVQSSFQKTIAWWKDTREDPNRLGFCGGDAGAGRLQMEHLAIVVKSVADELGVNTDQQVGDSGGIISGALGPIIGKLLGMLVNADGMNQMMKTLAKAAGLTPEQAADCEDPEYRHGTMKLSGKDDNKRGCLLRVFAKNFSTVLESIIIMLGNKLVDTGVDLLRTALQGLKSSLISAAGSVPFAGGALAMLVDIAWELLFNYGAKALLKGLVVNQLPEWLQVKKMARTSIDKLAEDPVIGAILGIILELVEAAITYGNQSPVVVGLAATMGTLQGLLARENQYFWVRVLAYAKKTLVKADAQGSLTDQLLALGRALVGGVGEELGRTIVPELRKPFQEAMANAQEQLTPEGITAWADKPLDSLKSFLQKSLGPAVLPLIASINGLPAWLREALIKVAQNLDRIGEWLQSGELISTVLTGIVSAAAEKIPGDDDTRALVRKQAENLLVLLGAPKAPEEVFAKLASDSLDFAKARIAGALSAAGMGPEAALATRLFAEPESLGDEAKLREAVVPYFRDRLLEAARQTGLVKTVQLWAEAAFGAASAAEAKVNELLKEAKSALEGLLSAAQQATAQQPVLKQLLTESVQPLLDGVQKAGGLTSLFASGKDALPKVLELIGGFLRDRVVSRVPARAALALPSGTRLAQGPTSSATDASKGSSGRRSLTTILLDGLTRYGAAMFGPKKTTKPTPTEALLTDLLGWLASTLEDEATAPISHAALRTFVKGLVQIIREPLTKPEVLAKLYKNKEKERAAFGKQALPQIAKLVNDLLVDIAVKPLVEKKDDVVGVAAEVLKEILGTATKALSAPDKVTGKSLLADGKGLLLSLFKKLIKVVKIDAVRPLLESAVVPWVEKTLLGAKK